MPQGLTYAIGADVTSFERGMARAKDTAVRYSDAIVSRFTSASSKVDGLFAFAGLAKGALVGFAAFEALKFAINATSAAAQAAQERIDGLVKIADKAQAAGVGTTFLQGWINQAKDLGTEASKLEAVLNHAREAATTKIGEGDRLSSSAIQDRLKQNVAAGNLTASDLGRYTSADGQEARIRVILDLIEQLRAKGAQLAAFDLAGKFFGADFETKLRDGVDVIGRMRAALDGLKTAGGQEIISPAEIAAAQRINEELERARAIMAEALLPLHQDIHAWELQQAEALANVNLQLAEVVATALKLYGVVRSIGDAITSLGNWKGFQTLADVLPRINKGAVFDLENRNTYGAPDEGSRNKTGGPAPETLPAISVRADKSRTLPSLYGKGGGGGGDGSQSQIENFLINLRKANDLAQVELDSVGKSNVERAKATELVKAKAAAEKEGRPLTDDEVAQVTRLAESMQTLKDRTMDLQQAQRQSAEAFREFGQLGAEALSDMILEGKSAGEVFKGLEKQIAKMAFNALLTGTGPLAGLFGTAPKASDGPNAVGGIFGLLSGLPKLLGFADGGMVTGPGGPRSDTIPAWLSPGEFVVNASATRRLLPLLQHLNAPRFAAGGLVSPSIPMAVAAGGANISNVVTHSPTYNIMPAGGVTVPQLRAAFAEHDKKLDRTLLRRVGEAQRRG